MEKVEMIVVLMVLGLMWSRTTRVEGQEVEDESEFDYVVGGERGPARWGHLHKEWAACSNGKLQSPIDLLSRRVHLVPPSQRLDFLYSPAPALIKNRGHDIEVKWADTTSKIQINNTEYALRQCHWHSPSEHTINGRRYDMELHLVHQNSKNQIAVIALLYRIGKPDKFLYKLRRKIKAVSNSSEEIDAGVINPAEIVKRRGNRYLRYMGSLTIPPCTQGVLWTIHTKIGTVSHQQIESLRGAVHDHSEKNARPLQARNGRKIRLFKSPKLHVKPCN